MAIMNATDGSAQIPSPLPALPKTLAVQTTETPTIASLPSQTPAAEKADSYPRLPSLPPQTLPPIFSNTPKEFSRADGLRGGQGNLLVEMSLKELVNGPPLEIKTRQSVRVAAESMIGVGRYVQAGKGLGKYRNELIVSLGDSRCTLVQVNDGHLAWSSEKTGDTQRIWRVNVMRLDEATHRGIGSAATATSPLPSQRVIGLVELLHSLSRDYALETARGVLNEQSVDIARGSLTEAARQRIITGRGASASLPIYFPDYVVIVMSRQAEPVAHLPMRIEYWHGDPRKPATPETMPVRVGLLEYPEVRVLGEIDPQRFEFPVDRIADYEDRTAEYVERFRY